MKLNNKSVSDYLEAVPAERKDAFNKLRQVILTNLPLGFQEEMSYGMIGYVVPHSLYPAGYHCDTKLPLPFVSIASQKNFVALYHLGIYADKNLLNWFVAEFPKHSPLKLDMGKSCIRFKNPDKIPFDLIAQLMQKVTVDDFIQLYEENYLKK